MQIAHYVCKYAKMWFWSVSASFKQALFRCSDAITNLWECLTLGGLSLLIPICLFWDCCGKDELHGLPMVALIMEF